MKHEVPQTIARTETLNDAEVDEQFFALMEQIGDLNDQIALIQNDNPGLRMTDFDLQAERLSELHKQREELLERVLERPAEAVAVKFSELQQLYTGRTVESTDSYGMTTREFVTRNNQTKKADLHFRELEFSSGHTEYTVEVPRPQLGTRQPFMISSDGENLHIASREYRHGFYQLVDVEPASDTGKELLRSFFRYSATAVDEMSMRSSEQVEAADNEAVLFLKDKLRTDLARRAL